MAGRWDRHRQEDNAIGDDTRSKLIAVGAEGLADALLKLASRHDDLADLSRFIGEGERERVFDAILARGYTKAYGHGARYLAALERLAESVSGWQGKATHDGYAAGIRAAHGRYKAFLADLDLLDAWHRFEDERTREALLEWCRDKGIPIDE